MAVVVVPPDGRHLHEAGSVEFLFVERGLGVPEVDRLCLDLLGTASGAVALIVAMFTASWRQGLGAYGLCEAHAR